MATDTSERARGSKSDSSLELKGDYFNEPAAFSFQQDEILRRTPLYFIKIKSLTAAVKIGFS